MGWARRPPRLPAVKLIPVTGYLWPFGHQLMWTRLRCPVALLGPPNQFAACRSAARPRRALLARCSDPARSRQARGSFMARRWIIHGWTPTRRAPPLSRRPSPAVPAAAAGRSNCRRTHFRVLLTTSCFVSPFFPVPGWAHHRMHRGRGNVAIWRHRSF